MKNAAASRRRNLSGEDELAGMRFSGDAARNLP